MAVADGPGTPGNTQQNRFIGDIQNPKKNS
jgi:hypothetical protein